MPFLDECERLRLAKTRWVTFHGGLLRGGLATNLVDARSSYETTFTLFLFLMRSQQTSEG